MTDVEACCAWACGHPLALCFDIFSAFFQRIFAELKVACFNAGTKPQQSCTATLSVATQPSNTTGDAKATEVSQQTVSGHRMEGNSVQAPPAWVQSSANAQVPAPAWKPPFPKSGRDSSNSPVSSQGSTSLVPVDKSPTPASHDSGQRSAGRQEASQLVRTQGQRRGGRGSSSPNKNRADQPGMKATDWKHARSGRPPR